MPDPPVTRILPHRPPFLFVDRIVSSDATALVATRDVRPDEAFFEGHFPGRPTMPGVLLIEAMAQVGGILMLDAETRTDDKLIFFTGINKAKFRKPVEPGDQIRFELEIVKRRQSMYIMAGKGLVNNDVVVEAELSAVITTRENGA